MGKQIGCHCQDLTEAVDDYANTSRQAKDGKLSCRQALECEIDSLSLSLSLSLFPPPRLKTLRSP